MRYLLIVISSAFMLSMATAGYATGDSLHPRPLADVDAGSIGAASERRKIDDDEVVELDVTPQGTCQRATNGRRR